MTGDMWITLAILLVAIVLFVTERLRVDVVALGVVIALSLTGILTTSEALSGFSNSVVITIAALFVVGGAVLHTGLAAIIGQRILRVAGTNETRLMTVVMLAVAVLSGFMSDTGTVAVLLPAIIALARSANISPSKLLIPLAAGSLLGGIMTLIGTPPNIVASDLLREENLRLGAKVYQPLEFFSYTPIGVILLAVGVTFMITIGRRLLPDHKNSQTIIEFESPHELVDLYHLADNIRYLRIGRRSNLTGKTLAQTCLRRDYGVTVLEILRSEVRPVAQLGDSRLILQSNASQFIYPTAQTVLNVEDVLVVQGIDTAIDRLAEERRLIDEQPSTPNGTEALINRYFGIAEVLLPPRSSLINKRLEDTRFAPAYNLTVLGINRPGVDGLMDTKDTVLTFGDSLIVQGSWQDIRALRKNRRDLVILGEPEAALETGNTGKAPLAAIILLGMVVLIVTEAMPLAVAGLLAAVAMVLTGCLNMDEAYDAIDWKSIVLIAGMLPMATALEKVGLVDMTVDHVVDLLGNSGPHVILAGLFLLTSFLTQVLSNTATAVLIAPIAFVTAQRLNVEPYAFLMGVAIAASLAFASPVASPVNTLIMGAGNYRFVDFIKVGVPMIIILAIVSVIVLPVFFPF